MFRTSVFSLYRFSIILPVYLLSAGALAAQGPAAWVAPSMQRVGSTDAAGAATQAQLWAGKGEYESFQIIVRAPSSGLSNVNVSVSALSGPGGQVIGGSNVALFREQYVYVNASSPNWGGSNQPMGAGWYPDGLIPFIDPATGAPPSGGSLQAVPFTLAGNTNQPIWVDIFVPRSAAAGQYTGTYTVTSDQGSASGPVSLYVWNFTLPLQPSLQSAFSLLGGSNMASEQELLRNKISPLNPNPGDQAGLMNGYGLTASNLGFWSGANVSTCSMSSPPSVAQIQSAVSQQQPGLTLFDYSADEINSCAGLYSTVQQWGYNLHQAGAKNLVTMTPISALFDDGSGTGRSAVDYWVVLSSLYDGAAGMIQQAQQKGDGIWSYTTLVQDAYSPKWEIDFAPINFRIQPGFISQSLNLTGMLYWRVNLWSSDQWHNVNNQGLISSANFPGEGALVYPGNTVGLQGVAPSMRLKWIRDGVEDYEYVAMLKKAGAGALALQVARSVGPDWTNWTRDPNALMSARQQLGQQLDQLNGGSGGATAPPPASTPPPTSGSASPVSAAPASGTGLSQTFVFTYSDTAGYQSISGANAMINSTASGAGGCWIYYDPSGPSIWLASDDGASWNSVAVGATATLQNSQCSVNAAGVSGTGSGNNFSLQVPITFNTAFSGAKTVYLRAVDKTSGGSAYVAEGTWTVPTAAPAVPLGGVSASPNSGTGGSQTFSFLFADPSGYQSLSGVGVLVGSSNNGVGACWLYYDVTARTLWLASDDTSTWSSAVAGSASTLQNSQCQVSAAGVSGSGSGNNFTLHVPLTFKSAFAGGKTVYLRAVDKSGTASAFAPAGSWTVPAAVALGALSVSPNSGAGRSQTFTLVLGDPKGYQSLSGGTLLVSNSLSGVGACWIYYDASARKIWLAQDSTASWSGQAIGTAGWLTNSQCSVNAQGVTANGSGSLLTVAIPVTFTGSFIGGKNVYGLAADVTSGSTSFVQLGSWTVQ